MPIRITFEIDTPEEAAQLFAKLPRLGAHTLPSPSGNLDQRAHERVDRSARYEAYKQNGGSNNFLGWAHQGEPPKPADAIDQIPADQVKAGPLELICSPAKLLELESKS
jgi:hypothetical protein